MKNLVQQPIATVLTLAVFLLPAPVCSADCTTTSPFDAGIIVVDEASEAEFPDGRNWECAYPNLQLALERAAQGGITEIWVAASATPYVPSVQDDPNDDSNVVDGSYGLNCHDTVARTKTFVLVKNVGIYGGFLGNATGGGETSRSQADPANNITTLSGDLGGGQHAYHVVRYYQDTTLDNVLPSSTTMVVDGFTITGGVADGGVTVGPCTGGDLNAVGGGALTVILPEGTGIPSPPGPKFSRCKFVGNSATYGGGAMSGVFSGCYIVDCDFTDNEQTGASEDFFGSGELNQGGGAVGVAGPVLLLNSRFNDNVAEDTGGGFQHSIARTNDTFLISNCEFRSNHASSGGGAILDGLVVNSVLGRSLFVRFCNTCG